MKKRGQEKASRKQKGRRLARLAERIMSKFPARRMKVRNGIIVFA